MVETVVSGPEFFFLWRESCLERFHFEEVFVKDKHIVLGGTFDLDQLVAVSHGVERFSWSSRRRFSPWVLVLSVSDATWATRLCTGIWDDMPGVIVELHEFAGDILIDSEDEAEASEVEASEIPMKPPPLKVNPL